MTIPLPAIIHDDAGLREILSRWATAPDRVCLDFSAVKFLRPNAVVALLAWSAGARSKGAVVTPVGVETCPAANYLSRIDFWRTMGIEREEPFERHPENDRFVTVRRIEGTTRAERIAESIASCIHPDLADETDPATSGPFDSVEYSVSELVLNVLQHAHGVGFISAQHYPSNDVTCVAISDCGIGIAASFERMGSPHWSAGMTDLEALTLAIRAKVSSRTHLSSGWGESVNAGVGLSLLRELARLTKGTFFLASGSAWLTLDEQGSFETAPSGLGTICSLSFHRDRMRNFVDAITQSKESLGLLKRPGSRKQVFE